MPIIYYFTNSFMFYNIILKFKLSRLCIQCGRSQKNDEKKEEMRFGLVGAIFSE